MAVARRTGFGEREFTLKLLILTHSILFLFFPPRSAVEGGELNLVCSHPSARNEWFSWYQQFPRQGLQFIIQGYSKTSPSTEPEGILHISEDRKSSTLDLHRVRLAEAAVYYGALGDAV
uniref:Immunoglobulin V-set domain-containing protein n=1 Tax=Pelusios castaneus TaxID=367368 RepID=A0A8C8SLF6_9SAUR